MKDTFAEWRRLSVKERRGAVQSGLIAFDTNVLLNLYYRDERSRKLILDLIEAFSDRIVLPHRAGVEFYRNRLRVAVEKDSAYEKAKSKIRAARNEVDQALKDHLAFLQRTVRAQIASTFQALENEIDHWRSEIHPNDSADLLDVDHLLDRIEEVFHGKVTKPLTVDEAFVKTARFRMAERVPPGFEDSADGKNKKPEPECWGDLILWWEVLDAYRVRIQGDLGPDSLVVVTDETKADWWLKHPKNPKQRVCAHPLLVREALDAGAKRFLLLSTEEFFDLGAEILGWSEVLDRLEIEDPSTGLDQVAESTADEADTQSAV